MPALITPMTELEAVNECLENIGQAPVSTISGDLGVDTQVALNFVRKVNRELQSKGWFWNTEENYPLEPDVNGDILLPANFLALQSIGQSAHRRVAARGQRLYDREDFIYTFTETIYVDLVVALPFEELPETARRYIALRAARLFQDRIEDNASQTDSQDEATAMSDLVSEQLRMEKNNVLTDNWSAFGITNRRTSEGIIY